MGLNCLLSHPAEHALDLIVADLVTEVKEQARTQNLDRWMAVSILIRFT